MNHFSNIVHKSFILKIQTLTLPRNASRFVGVDAGVTCRFTSTLARTALFITVLTWINISTCFRACFISYIMILISKNITSSC